MLPPSLHCHSLLPDLSFYTECRISLWLGTGFCCERVSFHSGCIVLFHVSHPSLCFALTMSTVQGFSCLKWFLRRSCCFLTSSLWRIRITAFSKHEPPTPLPHPRNDSQYLFLFYSTLPSVHPRPRSSILIYIYLRL